MANESKASKEDVFSEDNEVDEHHELPVVNLHSSGSDGLNINVKRCESHLKMLRMDCDLFKIQCASMKKSIESLQKALTGQINTLHKIHEIIMKSLQNHPQYITKSSTAKLSVREIVELRESKLKELSEHLPKFKRKIIQLIEDTKDDSCTNSSISEWRQMHNTFKDLQSKSLQLHLFKARTLKVKTKLKNEMDCLEVNIEILQSKPNRDDTIHQADLYLLISTLRLKIEDQERVLDTVIRENTELNEGIYLIEKEMMNYSQLLKSLVDPIENYQTLILCTTDESCEDNCDEESFSTKLYIIYNELYEIQSLERIIMQNDEEQKVFHEQTEELHHLRDQVNFSLLTINDNRNDRKHSDTLGENIATMMDEVNNLSEENEFNQFNSHDISFGEIDLTGDEELNQLENTVESQIQKVDECIKYLQSTNEKEKQ